MIKKILIGLLLVIVMAVGVLYFRMNTIVHSAILDNGPDILGVDVKLDAVGLSPFSGEANLESFALGQPEGWGDGNMISVDGFAVKMVPASIMKDHVIIETIEVDHPIIAVRMKGKDNNFSSFAGSFTTEETNTEEESEIFITLKDMWIRNAVVSLEVDGLSMADTTIELADIHIENLGTDEQGLTPSELARHVMAVIEPQVRKAITGAQGKKLIDKILKNDENDESGAQKLIKKGIGALFGKKKKDDDE